MFAGSASKAAPSAREPYRGPVSLAGKIAVVTGGTQGLGEAIARIFAERGAAGLVICGRNSDNGVRIAKEISGREKIAGAIVNIQSMSGHGGQPHITAYCASKGALATLTRNVAHSLLKFRIRVNGLNIGWMSTPGEDRIMKTYHGAKDGWLEAAMKTRPFGRLLDPKEVARACVYLCSDESGLMTGANVDFDQNVVGTADPPIEP